MLAYFLGALCLILAGEPKEIPAETRRDLVRDFSKYLRSECVVFLCPSVDDFLSKSATLQSIKQLSKEHIATSLACRTSKTFRTKSGRELQPCDRALHVIHDENVLRTAVLYPGPTWIILRNASLKDADLEGVDIRFDTELLVATAVDDLVVLTEVYRIAKHLPVRSNNFGIWLPDIGVVGPGKVLYERRGVLEGLVVRVGMIHNVPFSYVERRGGRAVLGGFVGRVWALLERRLNFTSEFVQPSSGLFGNPLGNGSWDGMIGMLINQRVHCTGSALAPTAERFAFVEFSFALYTLHPRVFIRQPEGREATWTSFLLPFEPTLWLAFLAVGVGVAGVVALTVDVSLTDAAFLAFTALFCMQSHVEKIQWTSAMVVDFLVQIVGLIALTCYGGLLYSNLAVSRPWMPFTSLQGLLDDASYAFGVINNTYWNAIFNRKQNALFDAVLVRRGVSPPPADAVDGYRRLCDTRMAFAGTLEEANRQRLNCTLAQLTDRLLSVGQSIAFPKGSPYRGIVDHNLQKLRSSGVLRLLWQSTERRVPVNAMTEYPAIDLEAVVPLLAFAAIGLSVAILMLLVELIFARFTREPVKKPLKNSVKEAVKEAVKGMNRGALKLDRVFLQTEFID